MLLSHVRNTNSGFTLIEASVVAALVGTLAVVGVPSFLQMFQRFQTNSAFDQVRGAVKEAQLQAIRTSRTCTLTINETNRRITTATTADNGCLLNTVQLPDSTSIRTAAADRTVRFNFQGNTNTTQTIVVYNNSTNYNKCLVISNGIGMMRWGNYTGNPNPSNTLNGDFCNTQQ